VRRLKELSTVSLTDQARDAIRHAILEGDLTSGERIPIERIADELGVSRTPVREALKALSADGLVSLLPHKAPVVGTVDKKDLYHRYAVRAMIEAYAGEVACELNSGAVAAKLDRICADAREIIESERAAEDHGVRRLVDLNVEFHTAIHTASLSPSIGRILSALRNPYAYSIYFWSDPKRCAEALTCHEGIAGAFREGDPAIVGELIKKHLLDARAVIMRNIK